MLETAILPLNILGHLGMCLGIGLRFEKTCWIVNNVLFATFNGMNLSDPFYLFWEKLFSLEFGSSIFALKGEHWVCLSAIKLLKKRKPCLNRRGKLDQIGPSEYA